MRKKNRTTPVPVPSAANGRVRCSDLAAMPPAQPVRIPAALELRSGDLDGHVRSLDVLVADDESAAEASVGVDGDRAGVSGHGDALAGGGGV